MGSRGRAKRALLGRLPPPRAQWSLRMGGGVSTHDRHVDDTSSKPLGTVIGMAPGPGVETYRVYACVGIGWRAEPIFQARLHNSRHGPRRGQSVRGIVVRSAGAENRTYLNV